MRFFFTHLSPEWSAGLAFFLGACVGAVLVKCIVRLAQGARLRPPLGCPTCGEPFRRWQRFPIVGFLLTRGRCRNCGNPIGGWRLVVELGTGLLFAAFVTAMVRFECQTTTEVTPDEIWWYGRIVYHLILISLLIAATGTDLWDYVIPDRITLTGVLVGLIGAAVVGDLQIIHLWVDWNQQIPGLRGPYIPAWFDQHRHWHGLAWSMAGLLAGGGITWLVRALSSLLLGREALGFGDVTLMAMIGSFVGWQPVIFVFLLAPLCGLIVGLTVRVITGRTFVSFGPYLSAAAVVVLFSWKWLWWPARHVFGHWPSLVALAAVALAAFVLLLGLLRLYRAIPIARRRPSERSANEPTSPSVPEPPAAETGPENMQKDEQ